MKTKSKLIILIVVLSVCIVATVTGVTVAYWVGAEGTNQIAPQTDTTDWNYWTKYFIYEAVENEGTVIGYRVVDFQGAVLENVIIPRYATGGWLRENKDDTSLEKITTPNAPVLYVGNSLFADTTDKAIPVTLTLPTTVEVEPGAFQGLVNLTTIKIKTVEKFVGNTTDKDIVIGDMAFFGCNNVEKFIVGDDVTLTTTGTIVNTFADFVTATGLPAGLTRTEE